MSIIKLKQLFISLITRKLGNASNSQLPYQNTMPAEGLKIWGGQSILKKRFWFRYWKNLEGHITFPPPQFPRAYWFSFTRFKNSLSWHNLKSLFILIINSHKISASPLKLAPILGEILHVWKYVAYKNNLQLTLCLKFCKWIQAKNVYYWID